MHCACDISHRARGLMFYAPDWRWLLERQDTPWYPSLRLFRQNTALDWNAVISHVLAVLKTT